METTGRRACAWLLSLGLFLAFAGPLCGQNVRLTEFLAVNATGITDEDGTRQPWIEIWNPNQSGKALITGTRIDNGTTTWTIPDLEIMPDERIIVWASGKNRANSAAPLHTNFTLPAGGGSLILRRSDNSIMSRINYPAQVADVSFGRDEWDTAPVAVLVGSYSNPTPEERNNYSGPGVTGNVVISQPGKAFTGSLSVTLSMAQPDPDAVIRYTTNGTSPIATSTGGAGPITLTVNSTQIIRARAYKTGLLPGEVETQGYLLLDSGALTSQFSSAMPLIALTNFSGGTPPDTADQAGFAWVWMPAEPDNRSRFTNAPVLAARVVMDRRGSSTLTNPKHNLNVEFRKARDDDDQDVGLLGMPEGSDWVFGAPYEFDRALIRNPFAYALSNSIGRYASRTRMAEVFIDTNGGSNVFTNAATGDYFGVYNITEKIRRDDDRVDVEKLGPFENDAVNKTGGYIFKIDRRDVGDTGFAAGGYAAGEAVWGTCYYYPKELEIKAPSRDAQEVYLTATINAFYSALQSATFTNPVTGYAAHLDIPEAIDHHLLNVWPNNLDAFRLSGYWHKRRGGKLIAGPVWDYDRSIDCSSDGRDDNPVVWRGGGDGTDFFNYTWWNRLFLDIDFYQKLIDRWQDLRRGPFSAATVNALIDQLNNEISAEAVTRDLNRWARTKRSWTSPFNGSVSTGQAGEIQRIKDYLQQRANFMDSQWVAPVNASVAEGQVTPGTQVTLTGPASSVIYYTLNGADPRPAGGSGTVAAGVQTYSAPITINATTRLRARAYKAGQTAVTGANNPPLVSRWSGLTNRLYTTDTPAAAGNLVITEINYHPAPPTAAEKTINAFWGDNDFEFVELRNLSEGTINLAGCQFDLGITFPFTGESAVAIPAGGYVILAANPPAFVARYGGAGTILGPFSGSLSNGGETLRLVASNASVIQEITYDDAWWPATDGGGNTLVVFNPRAAAGSYGLEANWRASAAVNGSPRAGEPNLPPAIQVDAQISGTFTSVPLPATVSDDGQPESPGTISVGWTLVSGPGTVQFSPPDAASSTAAFSMPGSYTVRLSAGDNSLSNHADVTVLAHDTLAAWLARHPGIGTATDDFDRDGLTNLTEFALLTDPEHADAAGFTAARESGAFTVTYQRQTGPSAPVIAVQSSSSLENFQTLTAAEFSESVVSTEGLTQTVKITIPDSAAVKRRLIRLSITSP